MISLICGTKTQNKWTNKQKSKQSHKYWELLVANGEQDGECKINEGDGEAQTFDYKISPTEKYEKYFSYFHWKIQ